MTSMESEICIHLLRLRKQYPRKISTLDRKYLTKIDDLVMARGRENVAAYGHNSLSRHHVGRLIALAFKYRTLLPGGIAVAASMKAFP